MSRTEQLRNRGARDRTGGGGDTPFVKWPQNPPAWVEGKVVEVWEGKYGDSATIEVTARSNGLEASAGKDEPMQVVAPGNRVNVGLNYAALKGSVTNEDRGSTMHFAFEGWGENKAGDHYRSFAVLEVPSANDDPEEDIETTKARLGGGPPDDDGLPFAPLRLTSPLV